MTSKKFQAAIEAERRRKNGIRKGQSEVRRFGREDARIPEGLEKVVVAEPEVSELETKIRLRLGLQVEPAPDPYIELRKRLGR